MVFFLFLLACGQSLDPAWNAAADEALAKGGECIALGARLSGQCADATVGAAESPKEPIPQFEACDDAFDQAYKGLEQRRHFKSLADLDDASQKSYLAGQAALMDAKQALVHTKQDLVRNCNLPILVAPWPSKSTEGGDGATPSNAVAKPAPSGAAASCLTRAATGARFPAGAARTVRLTGR